MNIKRRLFNRRRPAQGISGAVRRPLPPDQKSPKPARLRPLLAALFAALSARRKILALGAGGLALAALALFWFAHRGPSTPSGGQVAWQGCLTRWQDGTLYPDLFPVPVGEYQLSPATQELQPFLAPHGLHRIRVQDPFLIERHEVSVKAFKRYVEFVEHLDKGAQKERLKSHIGMHWNKDDPETAAAKGISWEAAWDYTDWLGQQTGCAYSLPTREQWGAATLLLKGAKKGSDKASLLAEETLRLFLWGVREWSSTPCAAGYFLVGEDDLVPLPEVRSATCMPEMLSVAGFRVAIKAAASSGRENPSASRASAQARP